MVVCLRLLWIEIKYLVQTVGYWIKPYDMLSDTRRWRFIPMTCCKCYKPAWWFTHNKIRS